MTELTREQLLDENDKLSVSYLRLREAYDARHDAMEHLSQRNRNLGILVASLRQGSDELLSGDLIYTLKKRIETLEKLVAKKGND